MNKIERARKAGLASIAARQSAQLIADKQTTTEIYNRLNAGGMSFKKVAYVTAILARFKDKWERLPDNKISLKQGV